MRRVPLNLIVVWHDGGKFESSCYELSDYIHRGSGGGAKEKNVWYTYCLRMHLISENLDILVSSA